MTKYLTVFTGFNKVVEQISIYDFMQRIILCIYGYLIKPMRRLLDEGDQAGYDRLKKGLPGVTPSGLFDGGRDMNHITFYNSLLVLDFDKIPLDQLERIKMIICQCVFTYACFISPSGRGLKVFVQVSTGIKEHRHAFLSVSQFYSVFTGLKIDPSGKDITRLCFVSLDPKGYLNENAKVFIPTQNYGQGCIVPSPKPPLLLTGKAAAVPDAVNKTDNISEKKPGIGEALSHSTSIQEKYELCLHYIERFYTFTEGQRNQFVYSLALQLRKAGFLQELTTTLIKNEYNYNDSEVTSSIRCAYNLNLIYEPSGDMVLPVIAPDQIRAEEPKKRGRKSEEPKKPRVKKVQVEFPEARGNKGREQYDLGQVEVLLKRKYLTHYNVVTGVIEWKLVGSTRPFRRLEDHHENSMFRWLHHSGQKIPINVLHSLLDSDFSEDFDPFIHYFKHLKKWDGVTNHIKQLSDTVRTTDEAYWDFCFTKWFVAMVASLLKDSVVNHTVIVLIGDQAAGKTTWITRLMPEKLKNYFGTAALQTDSKDTAIQLAECGLIILDELENLNRKDLASFKELITRPEIRIRRPYGRNSENLPHRASFAASVNVEQILTDPSGTRRYLCAKVLSIDFLHSVDINRCMAQAHAMLKNGFRYWFNQDEIRVLNSINESFLSKSIEEELIETWLRPVTIEEWKTKDQSPITQSIRLMTTTEIASKLQEKARIILQDNTVIKMGKILKKKGFERIRKGNNFSYMVRFVDGEWVDRNSRTLENLESTIKDYGTITLNINTDDKLNPGEGDGLLPF